jgi:hypothetical protein
MRAYSHLFYSTTTTRKPRGSLRAGRRFGGLRSEHPRPPRPAPAGPGDQARRATNQTCSHAALDVPRSLPRWKEDGRRALWKASRGPGASSALSLSASCVSIACKRLHPSRAEGDNLFSRIYSRGLGPFCP